MRPTGCTSSSGSCSRALRSARWSSASSSAAGEAPPPAERQGRDYGGAMTAVDSGDVLLIDDPAPRVRRLTLNRPEKRNALNDGLRGALFDALREGDRSRDVSVMI